MQAILRKINEWATRNGFEALADWTQARIHND